MPRETIVQIVGAALGVGAGLLFLFLGFFQTLLLIVLALAGWWLAGKREVPDSVINWISRIHFRR